MAVSREDWIQAQYSVIGSALIEPAVVAEIVAHTAERDFSGACLTVYRAIRKLFLEGSPVDPVSVGHLLGKQYHDFLLQCMEITPTAANVQMHIAICREQSRMAAIQDIAHRLLAAETAEDMRGLMEQANGLMVDRPSVRVVTMQDALASFMDRHSREVSYLSWPIQDLNGFLYAERGDFIVLGGYPSTGKSALALQCAWHWARDHKVGFFSLETSSEKLFDRQMASVPRLRMGDIKRNQIDQAGWDKVCGMSVEIAQRNLELVPAAGMTPADVRAMTMQRGYEIIFVDYLQLLQDSGENRVAQVTGISIALHTMAQSMGVTVVALSQLARAGSEGGKPDMSALRESGQIEQDADIVMLLSLENKEDLAGNRILNIAKNKEGITPKVMVAFDGEHQTFSKAQATASVVNKYVQDGKRARRKNREAAQQMEQMTVLPDDFDVPF